MAKPNDTSKPRRSRRSPTKASAEVSAQAVRAVSGVTPPPAEGPRTLEEAVQYVRALLMQIRATLHCLSEVLVYSDDEDAVLHAEVAKALETWVNEAMGELDLTKLRPLIEAARKGDGGESGEGGPTLPGSYMVREPTPVYMV